MAERPLLASAEALLALCRTKRLMVATAESCTGGLVSATLTEIPGSSDVVERGFVTYSDSSKTSMLGVPAALIETHGAVSEEVARAMAEGARVLSRADITVAITGIAGPGGGSAQKPVGLVHFAAARRTFPTLHVVRHFGPVKRAEIRYRSIVEALAMLDRAARLDETS